MEVLFATLIAAIIFLVGALTGGFMYYLRHSGRANLSAVNDKRQQEREAAKELILKLFRSKEQISNLDIQHFLGISDRSALRYLDELEKAGKIARHNSKGRGVFYTQQG